MKRTLNVRLLGLLVFVAASLAGAVHVVHGVQVKRSARILLEESGEYEVRDEPEKAADYLGRYLVFVPDDGEALVRYALLLGSDKLATSTLARARALAVADKALICAPGHRDVRRAAVDLAIALGEYDAARSHLKILRDGATKDGELALLLGRCEEESGKFEEAAAAYEEAVKHAPKQVDGYVRLAGLLRRRLGRAARADEVMDAREVKQGLIAANGGSFRSYLERAKYRRAYGLGGAEGDMARAHELAPDEADVLLAGAEEAGARGDLEAARGDLDRGEVTHPRDERMYQARASLEARAGRAPEAVKALERGIVAVSESMTLRWSLADLLIQLDRREEAAEAIKHLREAKYPAELLDYLDARLTMAAGRWVEARAALDGVRTHLSARPGLAELTKRTLLLLAECHRRIGDVDQVYDACLAAVAIDPPDDQLAIPARMELASTLAEMGRTDGAIEEYRKIVATPAAPPRARLELAYQLILKNMALPLAQRHWEDANRLLDEVERAQPGVAAAVATSRAQIDVVEGRLEPARALLERARDRYPDRAEIWTALAVLADQQNRPKEAEAILDAAEGRLGDRVEFRLARARHIEGRDADGAAEALAALGRGAERFAAAERRRLLAGLAAAHQRLGDAAGARRLWSALAAEHPDDLLPRRALLSLALGAGDDDAAGRLLDEIRHLEGEAGILWRLGRVRLAIRRAVADASVRGAALIEARGLLAAVAARRPNWSEVALAEAEIDDLQDNPESALRNYLRAIELGDRSWLAIRRGVGLLVERRRFDQADQLMRKLQDRALLSPELRRLAAGVSLQVEDYRRALEMARKAVSDDSTDPREQLWLGRVLWIAARKADAEGKKPEAEQARHDAERAFRRAVALAGDQPEVWVSLVGFLAGTSQAEAAAAAVAEAQATLPKGRAPLALAQCHAALGHDDRADALYREAAAAAPDDGEVRRAAANYYLGRGRIADAEPHLRGLIELKGRTPADAAWARRVLAMLLSVRGDRKLSVEAMKLLGLSTAEAGDPAQDAAADAPLDDRRARAKVLAMQPSRARRREAIQILEKIARGANADAGDLFLLAQLYDKDGERARAREQFQKLLASAPTRKSPRYPAYLASYADALLRWGDAGQAEVWLARLVELTPQAPATIHLRARLLAARRRGDEAATLVTDYVKDKDAQVLPAAVLLEGLGQFTAAEALYRRYAAPGDPARALTLGEFLARRGRLGEALDLFEAAWATCPPEAVAGAGLAMLYATKADEGQIRRIEGRIVAALRAHPDSVSLNFSLANLLTLQGRYADAEAIYRRMSGAGGRGATSALNNLAWLIAARGGDAAEARGLIDRAIALAGPRPDLIDTRALTALAMGRGREAINDLEGALAVAPDASMYMHMARARLLAGDRTAAAEALREAKAAGLDPAALHPLERAAYDRLASTLAASVGGQGVPIAAGMPK